MNESSLTMGLSALLSGIMEEPSLNIGVAEGRAQMAEEAAVFRDQVHHRYREEYIGLAQQNQQRVLMQEACQEAYVANLTSQFAARSVHLESEANSEFFELRRQLSEQVIAATSFVEAESAIQGESVRIRSEIASVAEHQLGQSHLTFLSELDMIKVQRDLVHGEQKDEIQFLVDEVRGMRTLKFAEAQLVQEKFSTAEFCIKQQEASEFHLYEQFIDFHGDLKALQEKTTSPEQHDDSRYAFLKEEFVLNQQQLHSEANLIRSDRERMEAWASSCLLESDAQSELGEQWKDRAGAESVQVAELYSELVRAEQVAENAEAAALFSDDLFVHLESRHEE